MNRQLVLTSCWIINENLRKEFFKLLTKDVKEIKLLYITTAIDGEDVSDTSWIDDEFQTILDLGIKEENIKEYKMDYDIDLSLFDMIYMMGGNTFYLLKKIRDTKFDIKLKEAINKILTGQESEFTFEPTVGIGIFSKKEFRIVGAFDITHGKLTADVWSHFFNDTCFCFGKAKCVH